MPESFSPKTHLHVARAEEEFKGDSPPLPLPHAAGVPFAGLFALCNCYLAAPLSLQRAGHPGQGFAAPTALVSTAPAADPHGAPLTLGCGPTPGQAKADSQFAGSWDLNAGLSGNRISDGEAERQEGWGCICNMGMRGVGVAQ